MDDKIDSTISTEVLIVGSGPVGATYARKLVDAGIKVHMVDMGAQETAIPGEHKKNVITFQKNINAFIHVIKGELQKLSVPTETISFPELNPSSFSTSSTVLNGQNPEQKREVNLEAAAATRAVGGMSNHWTCCTPEPHKILERPDLFSNKKWEKLFNEARTLIRTPINQNGGTEFEDSIRQQLVKHTLELAFPHREFKAMPLACKRRDIGWVDWSSSATVFGKITRGNRNFTLLPEHHCMKLLRDKYTQQIRGAIVRNLRTRKTILVTAKKYIVCAGAVLTPQLLFNSGFDTQLPALGRYMTEQTMTFCQVVLKKKLIEIVKTDGYGLGWSSKVSNHERLYPHDPLPFPFHDPDPQVTTPVSGEYPWHTQIHRDAFSYGLVPEIYDQRTIVDLRFFGYVRPRRENRVEFSRAKPGKPANKDMFGMPQPTFYFTLGEDDADRADRMMKDMIDVASHLGGFLPGALPQFMAPGSALHICGTTRAGKTKEDSCVDKHSRVHGSPELFLGGCNVIPTQMACNPTLTAMCFAIDGANTIIEELIGKDNPGTIPMAKL